MQYFRNFELVKLYPVSEAAIRKWIVAARDGRIDLALIEKDGKFFIANTEKNLSIIESMVHERKKFFNTRSLKVITPKPEFYELFTEDQVFDLMANLDIHRELPRQYSYFGEGAHLWDNYVHHKGHARQLGGRLKLHICQDYLKNLLDKYERVNVVDVGVGNAMPTRDMLTYLLNMKKLGRYIALDISPQMLEISRSNIKAWFGDEVKFEGHPIDINHDRFADVLAVDTLGTAKKSINLVLVLGGMIGNLRSPDDALKVIHDSMVRGDLIITEEKLDTVNTQRQLDFSPDGEIRPLAPQHRFAVELLGIDDSLYDVEMGFDASKRERFIQIKLKVALSIKFKLRGTERQIDFDKGETILLWRYLHQNLLEVIGQFERTGFNLFQASETEDHEYVLITAEVNTAGRA